MCTADTHTYNRGARALVVLHGTRNGKNAYLSVCPCVFVCSCVRERKPCERGRRDPEGLAQVFLLKQRAGILSTMRFLHRKINCDSLRPVQRVYAKTEETWVECITSRITMYAPQLNTSRIREQFDYLLFRMYSVCQITHSHTHIDEHTSASR